MNFAFKSSQFLFTLALCIALTGCGTGGESLPELADVSGIVTIDGAPLTNAKVIFEPQNASDKSKGKASSATTQSDGSYTLEYNSDVSGASLGKHNVIVMKLSDNPEEAGKQLVPSKYNEKTELTAEVTEGSNTINFDLKSK